MKKLLAVMLSVVLVLSMAVAVFAIDTFDDKSAGLSINDDNYPDDTGVATFRSYFTANRKPGGSNRTNTGILEAKTAGSADLVAKLTEHQVFTTDNGYQGNSGKHVYAFDLKIESIVSFVGMVIDQNDIADDSTLAETSIAVNNYGTGKYDSTDADLALNSGYGWTILKTDTTKARLYIGASNTGAPDYADFDLGFDAADGKYHHYAIYKDVDAATTYFYADDALVGYFYCGGTSDFRVYDAEGEDSAWGNDYYTNTGRVSIMFLGANELYLDNIEYGEWTDLPVKQNPGTGDASIVAFVAVAACVALVVLKKKETI